MALAAAQKKRKLEAPAPLNYVAGLGRGATGFTTRSDIGPARPAIPEEAMAPGSGPAAVPPGGVPAPNFGVAPVGYVAGRGRGLSSTGTAFGAGGSMTPVPSATGGRGTVEDEDSMADRDDDAGESGGAGGAAGGGGGTFDSWNGEEGALFDSSVPYDADDAEADRVYAAIEEKMDERRKKRREAKEKEALEKYRQERPKIQQLFADLKKDLGTLSESDWQALPEAMEYARRARQKSEFLTPVPDTVISSAQSAGAMMSSFDAKSGTDTSGTMSSAPTDLRALGEAKGTVLQTKLKQISDSVAGQTVVNPKGYLTDLDNLRVTTDSDIGDLKKAKLLLESVIATNPSHPPGWIALARVEEIAGRIVAARNVITRGCDACPLSEDVWVEASRLQTPENAKAVLANAIRHLPTSVKLWLRAAELEHEVKAKKRVLRRALEFIPNSVRLWKEAVRLEEPEDARVMLARAVECVPTSVEMWLALARLESYDNARKVLNQARAAIPTEPIIWISAAKLEEAKGGNEPSDPLTWISTRGGAAAAAVPDEEKETLIEKIVSRAIKSLIQQQVVIEREKWIEHAEDAEKDGSVATCQAIVKKCLSIGIEAADRKHTFLKDAETSAAKSCVHTVRAIYAKCLSEFPAKKGVWRRFAQFEKEHGTRENVNRVLEKAVRYCPKAEILWLMAAKENWLAGDVDTARRILGEAFAANPDSENIWLAAIKLESETDQIERARILLAKAREKADTAKVWMKSAKLERQVGCVEAEKQLLETGLSKYPNFPKLWLMRSQWEVAHGTQEKAREVHVAGIRNCPTHIPLWLSYALMEEKFGNVPKARAVLETGRLKNPKNAEIWLAAVRVESRTGNLKAAQALLAKALQDLPTSGILWAEAIEIEPRAQRKSRSVDALKKCDKDPYVMAAVAKLFWADRKVDKARTWFNRSVALNADWGDTWAAFYKFEVQQGTEAEQQDVTKRCMEADPHHGDLWTRVSKAVENCTVGGCKLKTEEILKKVATLVTV